MRKRFSFQDFCVIIFFISVLAFVWHAEEKNAKKFQFAEKISSRSILEIAFTMPIDNTISNVKIISKKIEAERRKLAEKKKKSLEKSSIQNPIISQELLDIGFKITEYESIDQFESSASWYGGSDCNGNYTYDGKVQFYDWKEIVASEPDLVGEIVQITKINPDGSHGSSVIHVVHDTGGAYNCNNPYLDEFIIDGKSKTFTRRLDLSKQLLANLGGNPRIANGIPVGKIPTIVRVLRKKPHLLAQKGT